MILVTGGAGYIGSHCVKELLRHGHDVVVLDNLSRGFREAVLTEHFVQADLLDCEALKLVFEEYSIDSVIHFAGLTQVGESMTNPDLYYSNNLVGTLNLLRAMRDHNVAKIIFSSSAAVYGNPGIVPVSEGHDKRPTNTYGKTKWMAEQVMEDYSRAYGLRYIALRYFNVAGCDPEGQLGENNNPETHLVPIVLDVALGKSEHIAIFGTDYNTEDGTCVRDYIHVCDLVEAHILAMESLVRGADSTAYNLGTGSGHSVREIIDVCQKISRASIPVIEGPRSPGDPSRLVANPALSLEKLGWRPKQSGLETIVKTALSWRRNKMWQKQDKGLQDCFDVIRAEKNKERDECGYTHN